MGSNMNEREQRAWDEADELDLDGELTEEEWAGLMGVCDRAGMHTLAPHNLN